MRKIFWLFWFVIHSWSYTRGSLSRKDFPAATWWAWKKFKTGMQL